MMFFQQYNWHQCSIEQNARILLEDHERDFYEPLLLESHKVFVLSNVEAIYLYN